MKKILLSILFTFLLLISFSQKLHSCADMDSKFDNTYSQYGYTRIFDCDKWTDFRENNCNIQIYMKLNISRVDFLVKSNDDKNYEIFLFDFLGRKLINKHLNGDMLFSKENLTNGIYFIKITDGKNVYTKKISI